MPWGKGFRMRLSFCGVKQSGGFQLLPGWHSPGTVTPYTQTFWTKSSMDKTSATSTVDTFSPFHLKSDNYLKLTKRFSTLWPTSSPWAGFSHWSHSLDFDSHLTVSVHRERKLSRLVQQGTSAPQCSRLNETFVPQQLTVTRLAVAAPGAGFRVAAQSDSRHSLLWWLSLTMSQFIYLEELRGVGSCSIVHGPSGKHSVQLNWCKIFANNIFSIMLFFCVFPEWTAGWCWYSHGGVAGEGRDQAAGSCSQWEAALRGRVE